MARDGNNGQMPGDNLNFPPHDDLNYGIDPDAHIFFNVPNEEVLEEENLLNKKRNLPDNELFNPIIELNPNKKQKEL